MYLLNIISIRITNWKCGINLVTVEVADYGQVTWFERV